MTEKNIPVYLGLVPTVAAATENKIFALINPNTAGDGKTNEIVPLPIKYENQITLIL